MTRFREPFPIVYVEDVGRAVDFYVAALGFELGFRWPAEGEISFAFLKLEPLGIGIGRRHEHSVGEFELCVYADDVDAAASHVRSAGATEVMAPRDEPWGERRGYYRAPDGTLLHVVAPL